ncbi:hypothetical protein ACFQY5_40960 [Paeniroseomonas aquatica]|uniref:hypothetical protein n=1 Tax=Paeniroseomonas aquatica TaxID=373043 RepID=UPI003607DB9E
MYIEATPKQGLYVLKREALGELDVRVAATRCCGIRLVAAAHMRPDAVWRSLKLVVRLDAMPHATEPGNDGWVVLGLAVELTMLPMTPLK